MSSQRLGMWLSRTTCVGLFLLGMIFIAPQQSTQAQEGGGAGDPTAKREKLFREGVDLYLQGQYSQAQKKLRDFMALEPRKELAARLVDEAGVKIMARMMANPRMGSEPTYIWQLYRKYYIGKLANGERMAKMAARVVDPGISEDERALLYREFAELGHYAVPYLAPYLADANREDFRTFARVALARMGTVAVLPLLPLLNHKDLLMRENTILTLTDIQPLDPRAIPALKARLEDEKESAVAKRYATRALERITGLPVDKLKDATTYYYEAANRYYLERANVAEEARHVDGFIWHLNGEGKLVPVLYPIWAWNEQMAEDLVLQGMKLNIDQTDYYPLAACIWGAQYMEVKELVDIINEEPVKHFFSEEEKVQVKAWDQKLVDCLTLTAGLGKYYVNEGLFKVLRDLEHYRGHAKLPNVGVFLCRVLADLDPEGELLEVPAPAPLAAAPVSTDANTQARLTIQVLPKRGYTPKGGTIQYRAIAWDQNGNKVPGITYAWSVAAGGTIDQNGLFTGHDAGGPYVVTAQATNCKAENGAPGSGVADVKVQEAPTTAPGATATKPAPYGQLPARIQGESDRMSFPHTSALVAAMDSNDQNIQYAGSLALAKINRFPQPWKGYDKVAKLLGRGVAENRPLRILVVEEDHNVRNKLRKEIEALGFGMTDAVTGRDAVLKSRSFPPKDLIVISDRLRRDLTPEQLMEELRADVRSRHIPVGILHNTTDRTRTQARFGAEILLVEREMKGNDLKTAIENLEKLRPAMAVPKRQAFEIAVDCATALSKLDLRCTNIILADAVRPAVAALRNRKDEVRIPAAKFVGKAKGGNMKDKSAEALLAVILEKANAVELRIAALKSLADVQPEKFEDVYHKLVTDPEESHELQYWAGVGFGKYLRTNKKLFDLQLAKRIDKAKKEQ